MSNNLFKISQEKTVIDVLKKLNSLRNISKLILFVTNDNNQIIGTITDGDLRRSLINNQNLSQKAGDICNKNFTFDYESKDYINLLKYRRKGIKILPLLNKNKTLSRIIDTEKTKSILPLECVIMAGGRGKRLSPLTDTIPKPMLKLANKPIIEHNIDRLISYGVKKIYISVKYLSHLIEDYFGDGSEKGIEIIYLKEDIPLGTAGALSLVEKFETENILVMNSDLFTNIDFQEMYESLMISDAEMVVSSAEYNVSVPYGVFNTTNNYITSLKEKPNYKFQTNAGIYIFKSSLINKIPLNTFYNITDLMDEMIAEKLKIVVCPIRGYWIDIGSPNDYENAQELAKYNS